MAGAAGAGRGGDWAEEGRWGAHHGLQPIGEEAKAGHRARSGRKGGPQGRWIWGLSTLAGDGSTRASGWIEQALDAALLSFSEENRSSSSRQGAGAVQRTKQASRARGTPAGRLRIWAMAGGWRRGCCRRGSRRHGSWYIENERETRYREEENGGRRGCDGAHLLASVDADEEKAGPRARRGQDVVAASRLEVGDDGEGEHRGRELRGRASCGTRGCMEPRLEEEKELGHGRLEAAGSSSGRP